MSDPASPERTGFLETSYPIHNCFVRDGTAYLTGNDGRRNPLVMVDVDGDRPREVGRWSILDENSAWKAVPPWLRTCHDVWVQDGVAYVAHWDAGTWLVDVSDPANSSAVAHFGDYEPADLAQIDDSDAQRAEGYQLPGNSHYATPSPDGSVLAVGEEAWDQNTADDRDGGPGGITLYDVTDPTSPRTLSRISPPYTPDPGVGGVWTTSHNFDYVDDRLFTSWYQGGVKVFDVSDPANPEELAWWRDPANASFWTAKRALGCFVASCRAVPASGIDGALYTFPTHAGTQGETPSIPLTPAPNTTSTTTPATSTTTPATTTTTATSTTASMDPMEATASDGQPGFGVAAALLGGALAVWRRVRRD